TDARWRWRGSAGTRSFCNSRWRWRGSAGTRPRCDFAVALARISRHTVSLRFAVALARISRHTASLRFRGGAGAVRTPWLAAASPQRSGASSARRQTSARLEEARRYWHGFRRCRCDLTECLACRVKTHAFLEVPGVVALD